MNEDERLNWADRYLTLYSWWLGVPLAYRVSWTQDDVACQAKEARAFVVVRASDMSAGITLSSQLEDDPRGRETLLHELLHICFADYQELFNHVLEQAPDSVAALARLQASAIEERTIAMIARRLIKVFDKVPEHAED